MKTRAATRAAAVASLALSAASSSFGCGHCIEDRVAAVYEHGIVTRALDERHQIAFLAIDGPLLAGRDPRRVIARALISAPGVDVASLRVSVPSASLSLSYDGKRISSDRIVATLNRKLTAHGLKVSLLKVLGGA